MTTVNSKIVKQFFVIILMGVVTLAGCEDAESFFKTGEFRFLSPEKVIARPADSQVSMIIDSMSELDKSSDVYPNAVRPGAADWEYFDTDYNIGPGDYLDISILDLYADGMETLLRREVSDSGYIDLPQLKERIKAEGMDQTQLTKAIEQAYQEVGILRDPVISVTILQRRQQTFCVLGSVVRPGTYNIVRRDMRLMEALALAGGIAQSSIEYIYVIRHAPAVRKSEVEKQKEALKAGPATVPHPQTPPAAVSPPKRQEQLKDIGNVLNGSAARPAEQQPEVASADATMCMYTETASGPPPPRLETAAASLPAELETAATLPAETNKTSPRWVFQDGKWVKITAPAPKPKPRLVRPPRPVVRPPRPVTRPARPVTRPARPKLTAPSRPRRKGKDPFGWAAMEKTDKSRVIAVNLKKLEQGDYRMNIVVRENDIVQVPQLEIGEFYMMGEVLRPGVYSLTGRKVTIKMAMAAAGNLGPLAWPENSVLIRRIGKNQEQMIPLNIENILRGIDPDVYLKKDDVIAVGTHWSSTFLAVLRNAFRMTYGFGFIYDRNFADPLLLTPNSRRFKAL
jgi:polysaccharide export outer membrane protein